jgi:hypothetical protein
MKSENPKNVRVVVFGALLLCTAAARLTAQTVTANESQCFSIHVRLNGKPMDGPQVIMLKSKQNESTTTLDGGCFKVPLALLAEKAIDVSFTLPGSKVYLSGIATGFFAGSWDLDLEDKKFGSDARPREACAVVFHVGEPETALVQTRCRDVLRLN